MRIVAGEFRSRVIRAVDGTGTRPTTDKVKEAIFSRIGPYFDGGVMLDLFGGSGNMSLEAISRGMEKSIINDKDGKAIRTIKENVKSLGVEKRCVIMKMDYHRVLEEMKSQKQSFDLVFLDPPYKKQQIHEILTLLDEYERMCLKIRSVVLRNERMSLMALLASHIIRKEVHYEKSNLSRKF